MFTFDATPVKFVGLFVLFVFTTGWCLWQLTRPADRTARVSGAFHLWMSVVMLLMVSRELWQPFSHAVPLPVVTATHALGVAWFGWLAVRDRADRHGLAHHLGHAAMFAAMTWHLAAMGVKMAHMGHGMPAGMSPATGVGTPLWAIAVVGVPLMGWLAFAGVRAVLDAARPARPAQRLGHLSEAAMNLGMFWMSTGLLTPLLPFMTVLAF